MAPETVLTGSVGISGANRKADVTTVQRLLNAVPAARGGPTPALDPDGICGLMTSGAIRRFQQVNACPVDGRIDPGMTTETAILRLLEMLGLLAAVLSGGGGLPGATPVPGTPPGPSPAPASVPSGPNTPVRQRFVATARGLLPPQGELTQGGSGPKGATGCGEFPGRVFTRLPVIPPGQPGAFSVQVSGAGRIYLTSPTTWWEKVAQEIDRQHHPARPCWVPFAGNRPLPGDIYLLAKHDRPGEFQHVGVIISAEGADWLTADGGQGNGWQSGLIRRRFEADGTITGEFGNKARLRGWADLDTIYAVARSSFPPL